MTEKDELIPVSDTNLDTNNQTLDPNSIDTTILAETFFRYEEDSELSRSIDDNPRLKKVNHFLLRAKVFRYVCFIWIWWSFFDQVEPWCKLGHKQDKFATDDFNCYKDSEEFVYYTFSKFFNFKTYWINVITYLAMIFLTLDEILVLFLKSPLRTKIRCLSIVLTMVLTIVFNCLYITNTLWINIDAYTKL